MINLSIYNDDVEDWIYDEFKTQSGIGIKEIRYGIEPGRRAAIVRLEDGRE